MWKPTKAALFVYDLEGPTQLDGIAQPFFMSLCCSCSNRCINIWFSVVHHKLWCRLIRQLSSLLPLASCGVLTNQRSGSRLYSALSLVLKLWCD